MAEQDCQLGEQRQAFETTTRQIETQYQDAIRHDRNALEHKIALASPRVMEVIQNSADADHAGMMADDLNALFARFMREARGVPPAPPPRVPRAVPAPSAAPAGMRVSVVETVYSDASTYATTQSSHHNGGNGSGNSPSL